MQQIEEKKWIGENSSERRRTKKSGLFGAGFFVHR